MRIVVIGGDPLIGTALVTTLRSAGHEVVAVSPEPQGINGSSEELTQALAGAAAVVDLLETSCLEDATALESLTASRRAVLSREATAGVRHHIALSAVGADRSPENGHFRARSAREQLIEASPIPYSIVRTTTLFEGLAALADASTQGATVHVASVLMQPVAASDVVRLLASVAVTAPLNGTIEIGGPEPFYLDELIQRVLGAHNDPRHVIGDTHARYLGVQPGERSLMAGEEAELGQVRFDEWLRQMAPAMGVAPGARRALEANEFRVSDVPPGSVWLMGDIAVFSVAGGFCATQEMCSHHAGPLSEGTIDGTTVTCPLHGAQFNIWTGAVVRGPAREPLKTFRVFVDGDVGRVDTGMQELSEFAGNHHTSARKVQHACHRIAAGS